MTASLFGQLGDGATEDYENGAFWLSPNSYLAVAGDVVREIGFRRSRENGTGVTLAIYENTVDDYEGATPVFADRVIHSDANPPKRVETGVYAQETEVQLTPGRYYWVGFGTAANFFHLKTAGLPALVAFALSYADTNSTAALSGGTQAGLSGSVYAEIVNVNATQVITCSSPSTTANSLWSAHSGMAASGSQIEYYTRSSNNGVVTVADAGTFTSDRVGAQSLFYRVRSDDQASWSGWYEAIIDDVAHFNSPALSAVWE